MASSARVGSIDAIKAFGTALWKFQEAANVALTDSESEISRTLTWLEGEQQTFWSGQIRKRHELVMRCKEAVRMKKLFKDSSGRTQSAVDEEKALAKALKRLEEAEQKLVYTKQHARKLVKEYQSYKGSVQRFATAVQSDLPRAVAQLEALTGLLDQYVSLDTSRVGSAATAHAAPTAMARLEGHSVTVASEEPREFHVTDLSGFPSLSDPQVALVHAQGDSGIVCLEDGAAFKGTSGRFKIFDAVDDATLYAREKVGSLPGIECAIYSHGMQLISVIRNRSADSAME